MKILLIADDDSLIDLLTRSLGSQHHIVDAVKDGEVGWTYASTFDYDLVILDVQLPKLDGLSICQRLRSEGYELPILFLTDRDSAKAKIQGLDAGADDYVVKPFDINELLARVRALLRRGSGNPLPLLSWGNLMLNPSTYDVTYSGCPVDLTAKEYNLLELFMRESDRIFSSDEIINRLWSSDSFPAEATVRSHLRKLRHKLQTAGAPPNIICTAHGRGYFLQPPQSVASLDAVDATDRSQIAHEVENLDPHQFAHFPGLHLPALLLIDLDQNLAQSLTTLANDRGFPAITLSSIADACCYLATNPAISPSAIFVNLATNSNDRGTARSLLEFIHHVRHHFSHWSVFVLGQRDELHDRLTIVRHGGRFINIDNASSAQIWSVVAPLLQSWHAPVKVMVVDDDLDWLIALPQLLQPWDMTVTTLANPQQFWTVLQAVQPDALVLDVTMPDINGLELCQVLRSEPHWQRLPLLFLSVSNDPQTQQAAFSCGADDYLCKPIAPQELAHRIRHRLARLRAGQAIA
jgi:DNA-binding response OmpR family regulator